MSRLQWDAKRRVIESEGGGEGLRIDMDGALMFDSNPLHRLLKLHAESTGAEGTDDVWDAAFAAHFERNEDLGDPVVLRGMAARWGLEDAKVRQVLAGERYGDEVTGDLDEARRLSVVSVPTVITSNGRRMSGNVSVEELVRFITEGAQR